MSSTNTFTGNYADRRRRAGCLERRRRQAGHRGKPGYQRQAFPLFSNDGSTSTIGLVGSSGWVSYLNRT